MTDQAVSISISIKAFDEEIVIDRKVPTSDLEDGIRRVMQEIGCQVLATGIAGLDRQLRKEVPEGWRNVGTEERSVLSSLGWIRYQRRIYRDEEGRRRKPVDEMLGIERYARDSQRVRQMGAWLACDGTYRRAARQLSWLIKSEVGHSAIQRMVWQVGNRIADGEEAERARIFDRGGECVKGKVRAPVLYGESDGVWLHLQREKRRSVEVRLAIMYTGKRLIGKKRYRLENKCSVAAIGLDSEAWQEHVLMTAYRHYDLEQTRLLVPGGDGNQWVGNSFNRFGIKQEFILGRFHLARAARQAIGRKKTAQEIVKQLRQKGFAAVRDELNEMIDCAQGQRKEKLRVFYRYIYNHQDGLLDLEHRDSAYQPATLGAIEGNVDKLVVHRMKGRGCCWRLRGVRAMLALCQHKETLKDLAFPALLVAGSKPPRRRKRSKPDRSNWLQAHMPIFCGPDQHKPWVREWFRYIHGD